MMSLYLPEHVLPGVLPEECAMSGDGGEQGLTGALTHCCTLIHTQVRQVPGARGRRRGREEKGEWQGQGKQQTIIPTLYSCRKYLMSMFSCDND